MTGYLDADPAARSAIEAEGVRLAAARRSEMKALIAANPREALRQSVPVAARQQLPASVVAELEERVNGVAVLRVYQGVPLEGEPRPARSLTFREAEFKGGRTYRAYVYGRREQTVTWTPGASLNGVAIDSEFAVNEDPLRRLEAGEVPTTAKPAVTLCPVSGNKTEGGNLQPGETITDQTPAVETATEIVYFCGGAHIDLYRQTLIMGEGVSGGTFGFTGILPAAPTPALGIVKVLAIPMTYADQNAVPSTEATLYSTLRDVGDFYAKASFGRLTLVGVVTPPVKLKHNEAWYVNRDTSNGGDISGTSVEHQEARDEARKLGFDSNDYDCVVVRHNGGPGSYGGLGGGSSVWARSDAMTLWAHEIGHCFGLAHANFWDTAGTSSIGAGANQEYGDSYDIMGGGGATGHYNAQAKNQIKWLPSNYVQNVTQSGVYRIYAMDQAVLDPARRYAMTVVKDSQKTYWGEVRSLFDSNPWVKNGMLLGWRYPGGSGNNLQLIDTTPGSPFAKEDAPISLGNTFSDFESGIHLTTITASDSPRYMDVVVNFGQFPSNHPPTLSLSASADVVPVGATVTFTATASDPDGDTLAYAWQHFGDANVKIVSPNAPIITRTFTNAGTYVVTCTASDMKGGTATRNQLITVGNGNGRSTISGRVTLLGQGLPDAAVTANGVNGVVTDADGYFTVPNLTNSTYTITPLLYGYTFGELFNNSVTVAPNFDGANFEAAALPVVTIAATIPNANEASVTNVGRFTITRTGDISQDLVVNVNTALGSATRNTDYTFTPDYVPGSQGFSNFTILADSATLDITVTPIVDTIQEGPETVILQLGPGNGYLVGPQSSATVVIDDDDTALPKISLTATVTDTMENSGQPAVFTYVRTGSTASNLTVNYTVGGTATSGSDYVALSGSVVFSVGATSAVVNVMPIDDSVSEPLETVKLTTLTNATYLIDPLASNATVNIIDDDVQTVTVVATDPFAREVDLTQPGAVADTGTYVITRTGDISNPLTVYYAMTGTPNSGVTALHGVDYDALPGVLVIPAGASNASVTIIPRYDGFGEGQETAVLSLGSGSTSYVVGSPSSATVTINDSTNDVPYVDVVNTASASEPSTAGNFRITVRGGTNAGTLTVFYSISGTATAGVDYTISGLDTNTLTGSNNITLASGATVTASITVTPINDALLEDLETITLTITTNTNYTTFAATRAATMWLRDDDQPTVYADTQVGTSGSVTITEGAATSPVKFYISRTGSTAGALNVNFNLAGTATPGTDYSVTTSATLTFTNATSNGVLTIPAGALGADLPIAVLSDALFEGTETINFSFAPGAYSRGPGTTMYIADTNAATLTVAFPTPSSSGSETNTTVNIPVTLSATSAAPVTVEYAVSGATASGTATTVAAQSLPYWVRLVRAGFVMTFFESTDGTNWLQRGGPITNANLPTNTFYAGLVVASGSATTNTATLDNFSITGLAAGGTMGAESAVNLGNASGGTNGVAAGVYSFTNAGSGVLGASTSDNFRFVYQPVTNSSNCTVTARLVALGTNAGNARVGVMFRADTNNQGAIYAATLANGTGGFLAGYRTTLNGSSAAQTAVTTQILPMWFKLERIGDSFRTYSSKEGTNWTSLGATNQNIALGPTVIAGLAVSAKSDGNIATATFDNVSLTPSPAGPLRGREVGFVNVDGSESFTNGVWTVNGSGNGIGNANDEAHLTGTEVSGDFTLVGRVVTLSGGAATAQAGVMMRQDRTHYARQMYAGFINNGSVEQQYRAQSATTAFGTGVDYTLAPGLLTFAPGETNKNITFTVVNDNVREPNNLITILLANANGAAVSSTANIHGYTIIDDDLAATNPLVAFAASNSVVLESAGTAGIFVSLSAPAPAAISVDYAVTGGSATNGGVDFDLPAGTLNFAAGESVKVIPVTIINDSIIETNETVVIALSNPVGVTLGNLTNHTLTILDDDLPVVTIVATDPNASEAGLDPGQFTISRTGPTTSNLVVSLTRSGTATSGTDFVAITASFTILADASSGSTNVIPIQDAINEGAETVILTIASNAAYVVGTPSNATVTIADDDRSTVNIVANIPNASETPGNPGQFTVTRTMPTNVTLTVNLTISGTASNGVDYSNIASTVVFAIGESAKTINILPIDDSITEGPEQVTISLAAGSYDIGTNSFDNVTIADNDNPPVLFISSPSAQGPLVASSNGLIVTATVTDDGAPQPVTVQWSQVAGPGIATFETPTNTNSAVTFSTNGTYVLRITATDGQFTVSDQATVAVGPAIVAADWVAQDMSPSSARRGEGLVNNGVFTVSGTGTGYAATTTDTAHVLVRQVEGDASLVARLNSVSNAPAPLAGLTVRSLLQRGATRAVLGYVPGVGLQFRTRTNVSANDLAVTNAGVTLPVWLKLDRTVASNLITAAFAPDVAGAPGAWTVIGATTFTNLDTRASLGFTTTANSATNTATAVFDNVTLTPAPVGPALIAEEASLTPTQPGSWSETNGIYTIAGSASGIFYGWQFNGDMMVTVKHANATSGAGSATSGIRIRESMDSGAYVQVGRIPTSAYNGYFWQSIAGGGSGGVPSFTAATRWIRIIRKGNSVTAFHAPDVANAPGTWAQLGQPQTVIMTTPVIVGFHVNNASGVGLNTVTFSNLGIVPLNNAPIVDPGTVATNVMISTALNATVTDDNFPTPPALTTLWSSVGGAAPVVFGNATNVDTTATFSADGTYRLRLRADDGSAETFGDLSVNVFTSPFAAWQFTNFVGGSSNALAAPGADPDGDGLPNLAEYGSGTNPNQANVAPYVFSVTNVAGALYFRVDVPKNVNATDVQYTVLWTGPLTNPLVWSGAGMLTQINTPTNLSVRDTVPISALTNRSYRVRVAKP
ncbi:MAG: PKD domain-containing protein [Verrucomicrobia bacterium]|nr:PKD domain-containing protein [Verrucomicrobiota bacterium]